MNPKLLYVSGTERAFARVKVRVRDRRDDRVWRKVRVRVRVTVSCDSATGNVRAMVRRGLRVKGRATIRVIVHSYTARG